MLSIKSRTKKHSRHSRKHKKSGSKQYSRNIQYILIIPNDDEPIHTIEHNTDVIDNSYTIEPEITNPEDNERDIINTLNQIMEIKLKHKNKL